MSPEQDTTCEIEVDGGINSGTAARVLVAEKIAMLRLELPNELKRK